MCNIPPPWDAIQNTIIADSSIIKTILWSESPSL